jgi:hypothetical protein
MRQPCSHDGFSRISSDRGLSIGLERVSLSIVMIDVKNVTPMWFAAD